ncbi:MULTISPECIES: hypothetical protein [Comamonas]|uniref:hypothetical protein n=1 Tax=Comamonas TaxID=283 RepID=UPI00050E32EB|nr:MULTISPECIES: hypothetical protein [Comamonas]KGG88806.1 hypothetical protein P369_15685 [Comamonas thiooxydans]KGG99963.1 hypothetical protein P365_21380 [Comamonas thiooxydans]KGH01496.1 hypothetical protein P367_03780 [Comamonas thiooxydans]KGH09804.1 hypothetical protein P368_17430 [Comamonas thiooxydans]TZG07627.1 hypothetical protein FZC30_18720 [Comamonas thiooxydans]
MTQKIKKKQTLGQWGRALAAISVIAISACGNQAPAPDWALSAEAAAQKATQAYLRGHQRVEALQWQKARDAVASTGQPAQAAKLELMRCAAQVASLDWNSCPAYEALAQDAGKPEQAYARYLQASPQAGDIELLPEAQRGVARQLLGGGTGVAATAEIKDPLSRLVAAGVLLRGGAAVPDLLRQGVDTASEQGWRRPLMAWLLLQLKAAQQGGDVEKQAQLQRRLKLLETSAPK